MAIVRELSLKINHQNSESSTLKFSPLSEDGILYVKPRIKAINTGTIEHNGQTLTVNYQPYLLTKSGSAAIDIAAATITVTETTRLYIQGQE